MSKIGNKEYIDCPECPRCRLQPGLRNGVKWGDLPWKRQSCLSRTLERKKEIVDLDGSTTRYRVVAYMKRMIQKLLKDV